MQRPLVHLNITFVFTEAIIHDRLMDVKSLQL